MKVGDRMLVRGRGGGCKRPGISTGFNVIGGTPGVPWWEIEAITEP